MRILDHDIVDPGTGVRWPFGLSVAGARKVDVIRDFIARDYPCTNVTAIDRRLGGTRAGPDPNGSDCDVIEKATRDASLIYDATAEMGVQHLLSDRARELAIPYIAVDGTFGGWGGRICRVDPTRTDGCWLCFQAALKSGTITSPPAHPNGGVQPRGCGDPTFTGAGFDLAQVALSAVRIGVSALCEGSDGGYPSADWDVLILSFRDKDGMLVPPHYAAYRLSKHPDCPRCGLR
jgi:hypothetical protein